MRKDDEAWMAYIDQEVRTTCGMKGWRHQIRRKWSDREKPVWESSVDDYEWKLILNVDEAPAESSANADDFEGVYFVLSFDRASGKLLFQHDTSHCGPWGGRHWDLETYTVIDTARALVSGTGQTRREQPPAGWLRDHLVDLTSRFAPNYFSIT